MAGLEIIEVHKFFGDVRALRGVSFAVAPEEIVAVLGPSGCGKSTLLAVIAGLETPDRGEVRWDGEDLAGVPPHRRGFGLMFQDLALFPHMDVRANIAYGLRTAGRAPAEIAGEVQEALELVGLSGFENRDVSTLSGGEAQRVALARALTPQPRLLLLDEPLGSLDRTLQERLLLELREILRRTDQTALFVTHDQEQAFALADRVVLMEAGQVVQSGTPRDLYREPASPFVARFLGMENLLTGRVRDMEDGRVARTPVGDLPVGDRLPGADRVVVLIRPDAVSLDGRGAVRLTGRVQSWTFRGTLQQVEVDVQGQELSFVFPSGRSLPAVDETLELSLDPGEALQFWAEEG